MKTFLRQYMAWAIDLTPRIFDSPFEKARLRLTLLYAGITILIIAIFSGALYSSLQSNMASMIARDMGRSREAFEIFKESTHQLELLIIQMDIALVFLVTIISYLIAGRTLRPVKEAIESQERFMADASHDLRTPLTIMRTEIEVGLGDPASYERILRSNLEEISKMSQLVRDLLTLGRISEDATEDKVYKKVNLSDFIRAIVQRFEGQLQVKNIVLENTDNSNAIVNINVSTFNRAIDNILQNAINYTHNDGRIILNTVRYKKSICIKIKDTGIGINEKDLPKIFDRFYKAENSRNDSSGSGLGLAIASKIIKDHNGTLNITSKEGEGTEVNICIDCV